MQTLRAEDYKRMPWKNGGGETAEIAVFPAGAGVDDFDWRISMATVGADGPFSAFPGIERTLTVLRGKGIELTVAGKAPVLLTRASSPFTFSADVATSAQLIKGEITDLNVMTRRGRFTHSVQHLALPAKLEPSSALHFIFCVEPGVSVRSAANKATLGPLDCVRALGAERLEIAGDGLALLITLHKQD